MKYYNNGGVADSGTTLGGSTQRGEESPLASYVGPYVTEMLGRGQALASTPYQAYMGPLTAGPSALQQQAYGGLAALNVPSTLTGAGMGYGGSSGFPTPPTYQPTQGYGAGENQVQPLLPYSLTGQIPSYAITDSFDPPPGASLQDFPLEIQQIAERSRPASQPGGLGGIAGTRQTRPMFAGARGPDDRPLEGRRPATQEEMERFRATSQPGGLGTITGMAQQQPMQQGAPTTQQQIASLMNPYIEQALNPQLEAAQRQADIAAQNLQSQYGKAGAYGGSRQGVAEAEMQRGLLDRMAGITGTGYQQAYDKAVDLLGKERGYGLDLLGAQRRAGAEQRNIEQQGIAADIGQFREERDYPYKQLQYMQSLLQNVPTETQTYSYFEPSGLGLLGAGLGDITDIYDLITGGTFGGGADGGGTDGGGADGGGTGGGGLPDGMTAETINAMYDLYDAGYITPEDFKEYLRTGQLPKG